MQHESKDTSAVSQASRAQMSKGKSPMGKSSPKRQAHKSDQSMGMMDKQKSQVNGYKMGKGTYDGD